MVLRRRVQRLTEPMERMAIPGHVGTIPIRPAIEPRRTECGYALV